MDLAVLERHVFRSGLGFAGQARWAGLLSIDGSRLRIEGRMQGEEGEFRGVSVKRFASWLSYDGTSGLVMRELDVSTLGGKALLSVDVPPTATQPPGLDPRAPRGRRRRGGAADAVRLGRARHRHRRDRRRGRELAQGADPQADGPASTSRSPNAPTAACLSPAASTGRPRTGDRATSDSSSRAAASACA